jgi:maleamate amidohydrolase
MSRIVDDLHADYLSAGFGNQLGWGEKPAVLVVDMCKAYVEPGSPLYAGVESAYEAAAKVVGAARRGGHQVLFTRVEFAEGGADGGHFFRKVGALQCFVKGNPLAEFSHYLQPEPAEVVVTKQYASAFFGTSLAATLTSMRVDTVVIVGVSTSGCVRASALDALQHGFIPIVVSDACGDREARPHESNLFDLAAKYADVVTLDNAIHHLSGADISEGTL